MLDIKWIRENPEALDKALQNRNAQPQSSAILALDVKRREALTQLQDVQAKRNEISKQIGVAKSKGEDADALMQEMTALKGNTKSLEDLARDVQVEYDALMATIPNVPFADVPVGADEDDNVELRKWGEPKQMANPQAHYDIGEGLGLLDFELAAKMSGARFAWLQGDLARLERALATFMLENLGKKGFMEVSPPILVNSETMFGTGQLPKFEDDQFQTTDGRWLIPTAEVVLTNMGHDKIFAADELPVRMCAWTPCFRREAGSAGRDTRGLIRMHQFSKVEMVQLVKPEDSDAALEFMTSCAESVLQALELPYRTIALCTGDLGFGARRTFDIEVWLPAQNTYREISSCSNCGDFQARRMQARYRTGEKETQFIHTLNGSGLAVGRTLVAVMENYQQPDGSLAIPTVLQPYMGGQTHIVKAQKQGAA